MAHKASTRSHQAALSTPINNQGSQTLVHVIQKSFIKDKKFKLGTKTLFLLAHNTVHYLQPNIVSLGSHHALSQTLYINFSNSQIVVVVCKPMFISLKGFEKSGFHNIILLLISTITCKELSMTLFLLSHKEEWEDICSNNYTN